MTDPAPPRTQTFRHHSPLGRWEMVVCRPAAGLRGVVSSYLGYTESATSFQRRIEVPGTEVVMIFNFGAPFGLSDPCRPDGPLASYGSFVGGLTETYVVTEAAVGASRGVQVNLTPLGAHLVLGVPMGELANRIVEVDDVLGAFGRRLTARLRDAAAGGVQGRAGKGDGEGTEEADGGGWERCFDLLDEVLGRRVAAAAKPAAGIVRAWRRMVETHGTIRVAALAAEIGCTPKHLGVQFRDKIGLSPKAMARVLRFRRVLELLEGAAEVPWSEVALASGYYDQAHFNRDFRQLTGRAPSDFLRRRLPDRGGVVGD